jgi:hypothetical protein
MDTFAPTADQLLDGHGRALSSKFVPEPVTAHGCDRMSSIDWCIKGHEWVEGRASQLSELQPTPTHGIVFDTSVDADCELQSAVALDNTVIGDQFFATAETEGITLLELFGGMCAGLHMCMVCGVRVNRYLYCDSDGKVRLLAQQRMEHLSARYPHLLPLGACRYSSAALPQDVREIRAQHLIDAGALDGSQWLVVAGWPCQDLSPAGSGHGLEGRHSSLYYDMLRVCGYLQQLQLERPPAYILENTAMQYNYQHVKIRQDVFREVCMALGPPVYFDAAQFGSRAHRCRNYWVNLGDVAAVQTVVDGVVQGGGYVDDVLDPGCRAQLVKSPDGPTQFQCNRVGEPMRALPTLVAFVGSHAFRDGGPGMVWDDHIRELREPNISERERALGYESGVTAHPELSTIDRHCITGRCMDLNALAGLFSICRALGVRNASSNNILPSHLSFLAHHVSPNLPPFSAAAETFPLPSAPDLFTCQEGNYEFLPVIDTSEYWQYRHSCALAEIATGEESSVVSDLAEGFSICMGGSCQGLG